jgi:hypothetical protein
MSTGPKNWNFSVSGNPEPGNFPRDVLCWMQTKLEFGVMIANSSFQIAVRSGLS